MIARKWWTWNGRPLAHPVVMTRRLVALPFLYFFGALLWLVLLFGWGLREANNVWDELR